jgi:hypothetical protein
MKLEMTKSNIMKLTNQLIEQLSYYQEDDDFIAYVTSAILNEEPFTQDDIRYFADQELAWALQVVNRIK